MKTPGPQPGRTTQKAITSPLWEETAGLSAIEQMMRAGVVVVSDIGGLGEVVGDAGLKFAPGDSNPLYGQLRALLKDPELAAALACAARNRARTLFPRTRMIGEYVDAHQEILCSRAGSDGDPGE